MDIYLDTQKDPITQISTMSTYLNQTLKRGAILGAEVLQRGQANVIRLCSPVLRLREVGVHLVTVKVGVVGFAVGVVQSHYLENEELYVGVGCHL